MTRTEQVNHIVTDELRSWMAEWKKHSGDEAHKIHGALCYLMGCAGKPEAITRESLLMDHGRYKHQAKTFTAKDAALQEVGRGRAQRRVEAIILLGKRISALDGA